MESHYYIKLARSPPWLAGNCLSSMALLDGRLEGMFLFRFGFCRAKLSQQIRSAELAEWYIPVVRDSHMDGSHPYAIKTQ